MYEREPYIDNPDWFSRALLVGDPTSSGMSCVYTNINIRESIEHNYPEYDYLELYDYPFQPAMRLMVDMGVSYFNYRGYGGMSGWYDGTANYLTNGMMLPLQLSVPVLQEILQEQKAAAVKLFYKPAHHQIPGEQLEQLEQQQSLPIPASITAL